jgi:OOP family OmpA-OmpF porin
VVFKGGTIELLDIVYFKTNKAIIEKRSYKLLRASRPSSARTRRSRVTVEGHTDDQGDDAYNKDLSQRRAQAVVDFLISTGVDGALLTRSATARRSPWPTTAPSKGRAKNRRVEFVVAGITGNVQNLNSAPTGDTLE